MTNEKFLPTVGLEPTTLIFKVWCYTDWVNRAWWKLYYLIKTPFYIHVLPIPMYTCIHKVEIDELERILSCNCTVLCYILEYIYIVQIAKRRTHKSCVCFQHANTTNHSTWSDTCTLYLHLESKHRTCAFLCYMYNIQCRYIPIWNTKQYI